MLFLELVLRGFEQRVGAHARRFESVSETVEGTVVDLRRFHAGHQVEIGLLPGLGLQKTLEGGVETLPQSPLEAFAHGADVVRDRVGEGDDAHLVEEGAAALGIHARQEQHARVAHQGAFAGLLGTGRRIEGRAAHRFAVPHRLHGVGVAAGEIDPAEIDVGGAEKHAREDMTRGRGLVGEGEAASREVFQAPRPRVGAAQHTAVIDAGLLGHGLVGGVDHPRLLQGAGTVVFELFAAVADQIERTGEHVARRRRIHFERRFHQAPHRFFVAVDRHLDPARRLAVEDLGQALLELAGQGAREGDATRRQGRHVRRLGRAVTGDEHGETVHRPHHLQLGFGTVALVGQHVGEGGHPGDVRLVRAQGLDHRRVGRRHLGAQDEPRVLTDETGELVAAAHQGALLDAGHEEHADHPFLTGFQRGAVLHAPNEHGETQDHQRPTDAGNPRRAKFFCRHRSLLVRHGATSGPVARQA